MVDINPRQYKISYTVPSYNLNEKQLEICISFSEQCYSLEFKASEGSEKKSAGEMSLISWQYNQKLPAEK